jgi:hypothetical protein
MSVQEIQANDIMILLSVGLVTRSSIYGVYFGMRPN